MSIKLGVDIRVLMDQQYSGIAWYTANLLSPLLESEEFVYRLYYNAWRAKPQLAKWSKDGVQLIATRYPNKLFNYCLQTIFRYPKIDQTLGGVDVFWSPHFNFTSLSFKTKQVITVHDLSFLRYPEFFSGRKNFWHRALQVKTVLNQARQIVAVSNNTKQDLIELLNIPADKITVIYSGLNLPTLKPKVTESQEFLAKWQLKPHYFLYLGNIEPRKNLVNLILAYNQWQDSLNGHGEAYLVLAGGRGWKTRKIYQLAKRSPYREKIIFLGYVSEREKEILYEQALALVYPSLYEGFGFPPLEALARGVPVICSNVSSLPEVVGSSAYLIDPLSVSDLARGLERLAKDQSLREYLIKQGRKRSQLFSWDKTAAEYLELFKRLALEE